jgi:glycosyltransferase involved in cell wall biosynthesis
MSAPVLIVSLATTDGWVVNERELTAGLDRLGVPHRVARLRLGPEAHLRRTGFLPLVDAIEAAGSRRVLNAALREGDVSAVIALSTTAALLAPVRRLRAEWIPVAIRVDCPSSISRPGPQNAVQRALERRRLAEATLAIGTGPRSAELLAPLAAEVAVLPVPVDAARDGAEANGSGDVVTYAADPDNKGLDLICRAWWQLGAATEGRRLHVTGVSPERGRRQLTRKGVAEPRGLTWHGDLEREEHLALLRGAAAYVSASAWEGAGIAQLEALGAGVPLVTTPSLGAYEAHPIAAALRPALATATRDAGELASALGTALAMDREERGAYAEQATRAVETFGCAAADRALAEDVLPRLGASPDPAQS